jgi:hypothetical protein
VFALSHQATVTVLDKTMLADVLSNGKGSPSRETGRLTASGAVRHLETAPGSIV